MSQPLLVGIDCGSQSAKVVVADASGNVVASGQQLLRPNERPRHGVVVHPDDDLWDAICAASRLAMQRLGAAGRSPSEIVGVGICPIRCCKAMLRADGSLYEPVISWMDDRAYQPYMPSDPECAIATTASGYIAHRCTGQLRDTAANNILLQWPIDSDTWQWSDDPQLYREFNVRRDQLVELQMPGDVIGGLTAEAAASTGLPVGVPVVQTANDKAVEMLGAGPLGDGVALVSLGTYIAAMVQGTHNHRDPQSFWTNFACVPHQYLYESSGVRRGMWTLTWFLDLLGPELAQRAASEGVSRESILEAEALGVPAGSDGLLTVLDWLAPTDHPARKGMMLGFDARHTRGHLYRSIMEAIALTMSGHITAMMSELGTPLQGLVISGGGANSELFMSIFASALGVPASRATGASGAGLGAAMCAAAAVGVHPTIEAAAHAMCSAREAFAPDPAATARYAAVAPHYSSVRERTDSLFEATYPIFHD